MATKFSKKVTREIKTPGGAVNVSITEKGVEIQKKGTRRVVSADVSTILSFGVSDFDRGKSVIDIEKRTKWFWK